MAELNVEMTYATALLGAAEDAGKEDLIKSEAEEILEIMEKEPDFMGLLVSPSVSVSSKHDILNRCFDGRISEELLNFMCILTDKGRFRNFPGMVKAYCRLLDRKEGFAYGTVYSTGPLSDDQLNRLQEQTGKLLNDRVKLDNEIDRSLIGGVKILIDGKIIDASLKKQLETMAARMLKA